MRMLTRALATVAVLSAVLVCTGAATHAGVTIVDFETAPLPYNATSLTQGGYSLTPGSGNTSASQVDTSAGEVHSGSYSASLVVGDANPDGPYVRVNRGSAQYIRFEHFRSISWWTRDHDGATAAGNYVTIGLDPDLDTYNDLWVVSVGQQTDAGSDGWVQITVDLNSQCHVAAYDDGGSYQFGDRGDLGPTSSPTHTPGYTTSEMGRLGDLFGIGYSNMIPDVSDTTYGKLGINAYYVGCSEAGDGNKAWYIDDIEVVEAVPEPAGLGLLGVAMLGLRRRRRS